MSTGVGFEVAEYERRLARAQTLMREAGLDCLLLTTEPEFRYFSGFRSDFWLSPTRPWYLVVPAAGKPVAVVPSIGLAALSATWLDDVRDWPAPRPADDGLDLLGETLREVCTGARRVGVPMGHETHVRMPLADFDALRASHASLAFVDATEVVRALRMIKSEAEIDKIRRVCQCASDAFENLSSLLVTGITEDEAFRRFRIELLRRGVENTPYLVGASGPDGADDMIKPPSTRELSAGDVLILDTGSVIDGYYCDFDRNYAFGAPSAAVRRAYEVVYSATEAGLAAARPGATTAQLWAAMAKVLSEGGSQGNAIGRLGHGLGMQLTEWPSNMPGDDTVLQPGMVLTLEPGMLFADGRMMLHEENLVVREDGAELLTRRAPEEIYVIED